MADLIYNSFKQKIMDGSIDLDTDTIKLALVTATYAPNQDTHEDFADVTNEISGTGYTAGGQALTTKAVTKDTTDDEGVFDADNVVWGTSTLTARAGILYKDTGTPGTSWLICYFDFVSDQSSSGDDFTVAFDAEGIVNIG